MMLMVCEEVCVNNCDASKSLPPIFCRRITRIVVAVRESDQKTGQKHRPRKICTVPISWKGGLGFCVVGWLVCQKLEKRLGNEG